MIGRHGLGLAALFAAAIAGLGWGCDDGGTVDPSDAGGDTSDAGVIVPWSYVPSVPEPTSLASGLDAPCGLVLADGVLYVAEEQGGRVLSVATDGSAVIELASGLDGPYGIARSDTGDVFVSLRAAGAGALARVRGGVVTMLATGQARPGRVVTAGGFVYWIDEGIASADGAVRRVSVEGGVALDLATGLAAPHDLAVTAERCFYTETGARRIAWVPLAGGASIGVADASGSPVGVAVDEVSAEAFWTSPGTRGGGWVHRADLDLASDAHVSFSPPGPARIVLESTRVLWSTGQTISAADRAGSAYEDVLVEVSVCDFAIDPTYIYWTDTMTGRVLRAERGGF